VKRRLRLRRRGEFQSAISGKRFHSGDALVGFAVANQALEHRVGVTVSRAVKGAVDRNRARRRLREVWRITLLETGSPLHEVGIRYDVVLIARPAALEVSFAELKAETSLAADRLARVNRLN
jgi:ribonuclease P protein component